MTAALVTAATVLLLPTVIVIWARTQVYDADAFADNALVALEDETVREELVQEIVDEIIRVGPPESISLRPLLELVTSTVVDSLTFREIYRDSVENLHRNLFADGAASEAIALRLVDALIVIFAFIQQAYPEVAQQLPPNIQSSFLELRERDWAIRMVTLGEDVAELTVALPLAVAALYGLALLLSDDRRRTISAIGIGLVTVGALLVIGRDLAGDFVIDQLGFSDPAVSEAIWDVYTRPLLGWGTLVGGIGVLIAVIVTGASQRVDPRQHYEFVRRLVTSTPSPQWGRVLRAALFLLVGVLVVMQRDLVIELAVILGGSYLVYYGLAELIWLAGPGTQGSIERAPAPRHGWVISSAKLALRSGAVVALVLAVLVGGLLTYRSVETVGGQAVSAPDPSRCNGYSELCDRRLDEVVFFGAHNAMSAAREPGWFFANHRSGIREQLEGGVRALLIDTWYGYETERGVRSADRDIIEANLPPGEYSPQVLEAARRLADFIGGANTNQPVGTYLCHTFCELGATPFVEALRQINAFLERNPGEVIILSIEDHISPEDTARAFITSGLINLVYRHNPDQPLPTLREMIERDERVVVLADNNADGVDWYLRSYDLVQDTPFRADEPEDFSCRHDRGSPDAPLFALNHWLTEPIPSPSSAYTINSYEFLMDRVRRCQIIRHMPVNLVIVNFWEIGDAALVVNVLNGVSDPPPLEGVPNSN